MKRIPYGISNFKKIVEENYYYVDKTKYIELIETLNEQYIIFLRPRRFGKSLFLSTLEYYYDKKWKEEKIFSEFYIGKNPTKLKSSYYIMTFTFSGINTDTEENTIRGFNNNVKNGIKLFLINYKIELNIPENLTAADIISSFFAEIGKYIDGKIYILIDEYDHFTNELLGFREEFFKTSVSENGFVRKFYEALKEATRTGMVDRLYITGVSSVTLDSMTSGFNIGGKFTLESELNEMLGFTRKEIEELSKKCLNDNFDIKENIDKLQKYYNGYKFSVDGKERVYNSDMILYFMSYYQRKGREPEDYVDRNVVSDYSKIGKLFEIGGRDARKMDILKEIIKGVEQPVKITSSFTIEKKDFTIDDFKSLLFYMGFLTIKSVDEIERIFLGVPNYVIKELYFEYFEKLIEEETQYQIDDSDVRDAIAEIALSGNPKSLIKLTEETLHRLSGRDFIKFDEKYIKVILLGFLFKSNVYFTKSEYEVDDGYIDIVLLKGSIGKPRYYAMFEIKYISKKDYTEEEIGKKVLEAKEQLDKYSQSDELKRIENMKRFVLIFCNDKCLKIEEI